MDPAWHLVACQSLGTECEHALGLGGYPWAQHHGGGDSLAPARVRHAEDARLGHGRMCQQHRLDLGRIDVLAAGDDQVVAPVDDVQVALGVEVAQVAGVQPAIA